MIYACGDVVLDDGRFQLIRGGQPVQVEPQVFLVLRELFQAQGRLVGKEELVAAVWHGRAVSDASIASRIRAARAAIGDDGARQSIISTVHGRGFRVLPPVALSGSGSGPAIALGDGNGKPSIAVLPFRALGLGPGSEILPEALAHEIIRALCRLRWLTVISRGSSFRFAGHDTGLGQIGDMLSVRYLLTGAIEPEGRRIALSVELVEAASGQIIWTDRLTRPITELAELRHDIVIATASALEVNLPLHEARLADTAEASALDAWANYHLGLRQMFRFCAEGNQRAAGFFARALDLAPRFARAHAGLSFTSFQDAFLQYGPDRAAAVRRARSEAELSHELDPLDPFAAFTLGRSFWLTGDMENAGGWLTRATELNPNYAQAYYSRALTEVLEAETGLADSNIGHALRLSPLDPLLYGMFGTRALALIQQGADQAAADWADRAATSPHAHFLISMLAVAANGLAGREGRARQWRRHTRMLRPDASQQLFFKAFPLRDDMVRQRVASSLRQYGLS
ncbi:winged helix-turn-helix domain-containing protein [Paracoccus ravus]|uniref:winged helix-turn-helix domain-containing protein n=1 Tax=Paracoccus ravus TaxID=2447760 RepID=UPI00106E0CE7|nr:winged helix-turn-helix domain-containing protein [Paracoccus ravus]